MKEKLTLSIDKKTKEKAKRFARQQGTSISQMVEKFLDSVSGQGNDPIQQLGKDPVETDVIDGAKEHDSYIYPRKE